MSRRYIQMKKRDGVVKGLTTILGILLLLPSCHDHSALEKSIADLRRELEQIKTVEANTSVQMEDMENRLLLMHDQVDSNRMLLGRGSPPSALPVVRLTRMDGYQEPARDEYGSRKPAPQTMTYNPGYGVNRDQEMIPLYPRDDAHSEPDYQASDREPMVEDRGTMELHSINEFGEVVSSSGRPAEPAGPKVEPTPEPAPTQARGTSRKDFDSRPVILYKKGMELINGKQHDAAIAAFEDFLIQYPKHDYADNALYWIGEAYYDQQMYNRALSQFEQVILQYPGGNKVPDSMLKAAFCYRELGMRTRALELFTKLISSYPETNAARLAQKGRGDMQ